MELILMRKGVYVTRLNMDSAKTQEMSKIEG